MANTNCLKDMKCPECGYDAMFHIVAKSTFTMFDEGADSFTDVVFDETSPCACGECRYEATVKEFSV